MEKTQAGEWCVERLLAWLVDGPPYEDFDGAVDEMQALHGLLQAMEEPELEYVLGALCDRARRKRQPWSEISAFWSVYDLPIPASLRAVRVRDVIRLKRGGTQARRD